MKKKIISLLCAALIFSILAVNVSAAVPEDNTVQPRWTYIQITSAVCSLNGSTLNYSAGVTANSNTTQSVSIRAYLQYRRAGSTDVWTSIYLKDATGIWFCDVSGSKTVHSENEYRIRAVYTATGASGTETVTKYSNIV